MDSVLKPLCGGLILACLILCNCGCSSSSNNISESSVGEGNISERTKSNMILTVTVPDLTKYISYDNGLTWDCDGEIISYSELPVFVTVNFDEPITFSDDEKILLTVHNRTEMMLGTALYFDVEMYDGSDWVIPENKDDSAYVLSGVMCSLFPECARDYTVSLTQFKSVSGKYRLSLELESIADDFSMTWPTEEADQPYETGLNYDITVEFEASN